MFSFVYLDTDLLGKHFTSQSTRNLRAEEMEHVLSPRALLFFSGGGWSALVPACSQNIIKRDTASPEGVSMATSPSRQRTAL